MVSISLVFRKSPYGTVNDVEGIRLCSALTAMDIETNAIFLEDGVYAMISNQKTEDTGLPSIESACRMLSNLNVKVFIEKGSLDERGIKVEDLIDSNCQLVNSHGIAKLLSESNTTIVY